MTDLHGAVERDPVLRRKDDVAFRANFEQAALGMAQSDLDAKLTRVNRAFSEMLGYDEAEIVGRSLESISHPDDVAQSRALRSEMTSGKLQTPRVEKRYLRKDGSVVWAGVDSVVIKDDQGGTIYFLTTFEDITERKSHEQSISKLNRIYKVLSGVNQALVRLREPQAMFEETCRILIEDGGYAMARIGLIEPDGVHVRSAAASSTGGAHLGVFNLALGSEPASTSPVALAISTSRRQVVQDIEREAVPAPWRARALADGHHSTAAFPLLASGRVIGALNIAAAEPEFFDSDQLALLDELAGDMSFSLDVAEGQEKRRHAERELIESQGWLLESQHTAHIGHYVYDVGKDWWDGSPTLYDVLGVDEGDQRDLAGWLATVHPADREEMSTYFTQVVLSERTPFDKDYRVLRQRDGAERWVHGNGTVEWSDDGRPLSMFGTIQDIDERKRAEEQHEAILQSAMDGFWLCDVRGRLREVNQAYCDMSGYSKSELLTMGIADIEVLEAPSEVAEHSARIAREGRDRFETKHRRKDGTVFDVESSVHLQPETGLLSAFQRDVTDRKRAEVALRDNEERLEESERKHRTILESVQAGIVIIDPATHTIVDVNPAAAALIGETKEQIVGTVCRRHICSAEEGQCPITDLNQVVDNSERVLLGGDGRSIPVIKTVVPVVLQGQQRLIESFVDISDRKRTEEQLANAFSSLIEVVGRMTETRDPYTAVHQRRVAELAVAIAERMGMPDKEVEEIHNASLVHDIGKMSIPAEILSKPGALLPVEFELIKGHAKAGYEILEASDMPGQVPEIVYQHHERCDGSGYPRGLCADELLPQVKVIMVADVVEAMMSHRPYRAGMGTDAALHEIEAGAGTKYDSDASTACLSVFREQGFQFTLTA